MRTAALISYTESSRSFAARARCLHLNNTRTTRSFSLDVCHEINKSRSGEEATGPPSRPSNDARKAQIKVELSVRSKICRSIVARPVRASSLALGLFSLGVFPSSPLWLLSFASLYEMSGPLPSCLVLVIDRSRIEHAD